MVSEYALIDDNGTTVFKGTAQECADYCGLKQVWKYEKNGEKIRRKYSLKRLGKIDKETRGKPKGTKWDKPKVEKPKPKPKPEKKDMFDYLFRHLSKCGNTVSNENPEKYLQRLADVGLPCSVRISEGRVIEDRVTNVTTRGRKDRFYVLEVNHDLSNLYNKAQTVQVLQADDK